MNTEMKTEKCDFSISAIIIRTDKQDLNEKGLKVNVIVKEMCMEKNMFFIDHYKKIKASHLNSSKIHLNKKGTIYLAILLHNIFRRSAIDSCQVTFLVVICLELVMKKMNLAI